MKSILLHADDDRFLESRLQRALELVRHVDGHLLCLQTRRTPAFVATDTSGFSTSASMVVQLIEEEAQAAASARQKLDDRLQGENVDYDFAESMGEPRQTLAEQSLLADVVLMTLPPADQRAMLQTLASVVVNADAPVLAVQPDAAPLAFDKPVMVAWKSTPEAAHALRSSVTLLKQAPQVHVVAIDPPEHERYPANMAAAYLARHGAKASVRRMPRGSGSTSDALLAAAHELGAGLIVMGGYGRGRALEFLLGGVTRRLLNVSDIPLLLDH